MNSGTIDVKTINLLLFDAVEEIDSIGFQFHFEVETPCADIGSGEIDTGDVLKSNVHWGFVDVNESLLQRIQEPRRLLESATDCWCSRITANKRGHLNSKVP